MANNKLMILGAGRGQVGLIKTAKEMGYHTIVTSIKGNYPGFALADEICYADISNPEEVCKAAKALGVGGVATACLDTGITALGYTCEKLGLCGLSAEAARLSGNKWLMKQAFAEYGVSTAAFEKVSTVDELKAVIDRIGLPVIVKAIDLQGSRGITIAHSVEDAVSGFEYAMGETAKDFCIVEQFIEGEEFGASAFVYRGEILYVIPTGDVTFKGKTGVPVGHNIPVDLSADEYEQADRAARLAIKALGLNNCAVNIDFIRKDGKVYVIELTGRIGANCLAELTSIYRNIDIYKLIADTAMGKDPRPYLEAENTKTPCCSKMLFSDRSGVLKDIINENGDDEGIYEISFFVNIGENVNKFTNSKDCVGQVIVKTAPDGDACAFAEEVVSKIKLVVE